MTLRSAAVATVVATFTLTGSPAIAQAVLGPFTCEFRFTR
jgi:hypothetical protein